MLSVSTIIQLLCFFFLKMMISVTFLDKLLTTIMAPQDRAMLPLPYVTNQVAVFVEFFMAFTTYMLLGTQREVPQFHLYYIFRY
jgi:hypothetical protein